MEINLTKLNLFLINYSKKNERQICNGNNKKKKSPNKDK